MSPRAASRAARSAAPEPAGGSIVIGLAAARPRPAGPGPAREDTAGRLGRIPGWLRAGIAYLALGVAMWWHVWTTDPASAMVCQCGDPASFVWFLDWPAQAIRHGHSLFFSTSVHVPGGMNLLDNTSVLALGVVLVPVTWLFGPVATLNVALTAAPVLAALSGYASLRRALGLRWPAAFLGGLLFGFSPFVLRNEAIAHLQTTFLALLPLIFWCCYELTVAQRGRWQYWGLALGLLASVQFFVSTEMLAVTALTTGIAFILMIVAGLRRKGTLGARLPYAWRGFALAGGVAGLLLAYPLWFALAGPGHIEGQLWTQPRAAALARVLVPLGRTVAGQRGWVIAGYQGPVGADDSYLGLLALAVLAVAVWLVRRPLTRLCLAMTVIMVWLSLGATRVPLWQGGEPAVIVLPWRLVAGLPVLDQVTPANLSVAAVWFTVLAGAVLVDHLLPAGAGSRAGAVGGAGAAGGAGAGEAGAGEAGAGEAGAGGRAAGGGRLGWIAGRPRAAAGAVSLALVLPWLLAWPLPYTTTPVRTPAWVAREAPRLPAGSVVLYYPFPDTWQDKALVWQAEQGMRYSIVGGRGIVAVQGGAADHGFDPATAEGKLSALTTPYAPYTQLGYPQWPDQAGIAAFRRELRHWGVTDVAITSGGRNQGYARRWLARMLGAPPHREDGAWVWRDVPRLIR